MLNLDDFSLTRLQYEYYEGDKNPRKADTEFPLTFDYEIGLHKSDPLRFRLRLNFELSRLPGNVSGYTLQAQITGYFASETVVGDPINGDLVVHGCSLLYGVLRGQLSLITGGAPLGRIVLPTVPMGDIVRNIQDSRVKEAEAEKRASATRQVPADVPGRRRAMGKRRSR